MNRTWVVVFLLLIAFYVRIHNIMALPPFNDESHHIRRAEIVWTFEDPDLSLTVGKLLTYYWIGIFNPERLDAVFVARTVTGLFALLGLAAAFAVGQRLFKGGLAALYIAAFAPFMIFFDRLAFSDPLTAALGMLVVWGSLKMVDDPPEWLWGFLTGILVTLTVLAKLIGLPFAAVPALAVLLLARGNWRSYWKTLTACYITIFVTLLPFALRILYKELSGNRISVVDPNLINTESPLEVIQSNLEHLVEANWVLHGGLLLALLLVGMIVLLRAGQWRQTLFLLGCVALPWFLSVFLAGRLSTRYLQLGILPLLVLIGGGVTLTVRRQPLLIWAVISVWVIIFVRPFMLSAWTDPRELALPERDQWEYFENFTAGYGLMEAANFAETLPASTTSGRIPMIGLVGSCHQIRLYMDEFGPVFLQCPAFGWEGEYMTELANFVEQRAEQESILYLLVEPELEFIDLEQLTVPITVLARFPRPFDGMVVEIWEVRL